MTFTECQKGGNKMKHTHKTLLALLLVAVMALSVVACDMTDIKDIEGDTSGDIKDIISDGNNETNDGNDSIQESGPQNENNSENSTDLEEDIPSIEENILFEYYGLVVTAKEIVDNTIWGVGIKVHIENNSNKDYSIGVEQAIVNNCMITDLFSCTVASGKKANDTIYLSSSDLKASGIDNIGQVELYFYVYDPTTYERIYETDCITIKTSDYDTMDTTIENAGYTLYNDNDIKIVGKYVDEYKLLGKAIVLYIVNNREENITISCDDMSINGYMVTPFFVSTVYSGKYAIDEITILRTDLEGNGITEIENFALKFRAYNSDTYQTIVTTEELSFSAK